MIGEILKVLCVGTMGVIFSIMCFKPSDGEFIIHQLIAILLLFVAYKIIKFGERKEDEGK